MATITTQTIKVDLTPGRVYPVLHVSQGDVGLEALEFYIYQNNQPYPIPSEVTTINIDGMTSAGVFSYPCTWSGNVVTAGLTATMTAERGIDICELAFYDATNNKIGTCNFVIAVEESPFTNAHVSTSDMATIMAAATEVQQNTLLSKSWAVGDTGIRTGENTNNSEYWSEISESWAVGDTGKRTGENTNNSEYWSTVSHQYANTISFKTYDTVAQMKADTGLLDGGVCRTLGYYAMNDGGGALYKISSAQPSTYFETLNNGRYAKIVFGNYTIPEQFGAVGDGVTDDSAAVEAASLYGILKGGDKSHVYYIGTACTIHNGAVSCRFKVSITISAMTVAGKIFADNEVTNDYERYTDDMGRGQVSLRINNATNAVIKNNHFHDMYNVMDIVGCDGLTIEGNTFENIYSTVAGIAAGGNGYGLLLYDSKDVLINNNIFDNVYRHAIYISVSPNAPGSVDYNVKITGNIFTAPAMQTYEHVTGYEAAIRARSPYGCTIEGNTFYKVVECVTFTSQTDGSVVSESIYNVFKDNVITDVPRLISAQKALVDVTSDAGTLVRNLLIDGNVANNIEIPLVVPDFTDNVVIKNNYVYTEIVADNDAIIKTNTNVSKLTVIDNVFKTSGAIFRFYNTNMSVDIERNKFDAVWFCTTAISTSVTAAVAKDNVVTIGTAADTSYMDVLALQSSFVNLDFSTHTTRNNVNVETLPTGMYWIQNGTNLPSESAKYGFLITLRDDPDYGRMIFYPYNNNNVYVRFKNSATWGTWARVSSTAVSI